MEGLVNYSSEDEQDEKVSKPSAERGSNSRRTPPSHATDELRRRGGTGLNNSGSSNSAAPSSSSGGRSYKEEGRYTSSSSGGHSSNRGDSLYQSNRENRGEARDMKGGDQRDSRDNRDRESRDYSNGNKSDYKHDRFNKSKDYDSRDHRRDDCSRDQRRLRDDDRNQRGSGGNSSYNSRNFSQQRDNRYSSGNNRHSESFNSRRHQDRRSDRIESRSDRYGSTRKQRSPASHSPSPPSSSTPSSSHSKRHSHRVDEFRSRNRGRSRSRSHSRSRSPRPHKRSPSPRSAHKPLDQVRSTALDLERKLGESKSEHDSYRSESARHIEAVVSLPLSETAPKPPTVIAVAPMASNLGNSEPAVIQLPSYYNPSVINPNKYAEQVQKRKLIWGAKKADDSSAKWGHAQFAQDSDGKVASKFMRLMGIKGGVTSPQADAVTTSEVEKQPATATDVKSREQMFSSMEQQYEVARQVTHTMRGVGLGFGSSQSRPF